MNLVREHITQFERDVDPKKSMKIGMQEQINQWMKSINRSNLDNDTTLLYASRYGKTEFVNYLLHEGDANPYIENNRGLKLAVKFGHIDIARLFIQIYDNIDDITTVKRQIKEEIQKGLKTSEEGNKMIKLLNKLWTEKRRKNKIK